MEDDRLFRTCERLTVDEFGCRFLLDLSVTGVNILISVSVLNVCIHCAREIQEMYCILYTEFMLQF